MDKLPRFWFGQLVESAWFNDERDRLMTDKGVIVGIACKLPEFLLEGWWYAIEYTALDDSTWIPPGHISWVHESELRILSGIASFMSQPGPVGVDEPPTKHA